MAVAAGHDRVDEIVAALDQIALLRLRRAGHGGSERRGNDKCAMHRYLPRPVCRASSDSAMLTRRYAARQSNFVDRVRNPKRFMKACQQKRATEAALLKS